MKGFWWRLGAAAASVSTAAGLLVAAPTVASSTGAVADSTTPATRFSDGMSPTLEALAEQQPRSDRAIRHLGEQHGVPVEGAGSLNLGQAVATVEVLIRTSVPVETVLAPLSDLGVQVTATDTESRQIAAVVAISQLEALSRIEGVHTVTESLAPAIATPAVPQAPSVHSQSVDCSGTVDSAANTQLKAALARSTHNVSGAGVSVGVLSDSFDLSSSTPTNATSDVAAGELPGLTNPCGHSTPVTVLHDDMDPQTATDEGRAMLQLIHDVAPGAQLYFSSAFVGSEIGFANRIREMADLGVKVIVDDVTYLSEPMFQDGVVATAVKYAVEQGSVYVSAAGNFNLIVDGKDVASLQTTNNSLAGCPVAVANDFTLRPSPPTANFCANFSPTGVDTTAAYTLDAHSTIDVLMQINQPINGITNDFDLALVNEAETLVLNKSTNDGPGMGAGWERVSWRNNSSSPVLVKVAVSRYQGATVPAVKILVRATSGTIVGAEYQQSQGNLAVGPTIFGHNGTSSAITVAATAYNDGTTVEPFSARGPVTHYWQPVVGVAPASAYPSPQIISKPDLAATDLDCTTFFGNAGSLDCPYRFSGTSAAAPNTAGVAALVLQASPTASPRQIKDRLQATASGMSGGAYASGAGLVDALAALNAAPPPGPSPTPSSSPSASPSPSASASPSATATPSASPSPSASTTPPAPAAPAPVPAPTAPPALRVKVTSIQVLKRGKARVRFTTEGLVGSIKATATCTPIKKGKARKASSPNHAVVVTGLKRGQRYRCTVTVTGANRGPASTSPSRPFKAK